MHFIEINNELVNLDNITYVETYVDENFQNKEDYEYILIITSTSKGTAYRLTSRKDLDKLYNFIKGEIEALSERYMSKITVPIKEED